MESEEHGHQIGAAAGMFRRARGEGDFTGHVTLEGVRPGAQRVGVGPEQRVVEDRRGAGYGILGSHGILANASRNHDGGAGQPFC